MGRPRIYTTKEMIAALVKKKGMVYLAAELVGCNPDTIYDRAKDEPSLAACIKEQRGKVIDKSEMKLFAAMEDDQPWAIQMILRTIGKDRGYFEKQELDTATKGTLAITEEIVDAEQDDQAAPGPVPVPPQ